MQAYDLDSLRPVERVPGELARAGTNPSEFELREMLPGLPDRDYEAILWQLRRLTTPLNRHERRARASVERRARRSTERAIELSLDAYERITSMFTEDEKRQCAHACKTKHPHPDGRFAPTALDSELTELRRSLFEIALAFRIHNRRSRRIARMQQAMRRAAA